MMAMHSNAAPLTTSAGGAPCRDQSPFTCRPCSQSAPYCSIPLERSAGFSQRSTCGLSLSMQASSGTRRSWPMDSVSGTHDSVLVSCRIASSRQAFVSYCRMTWKDSHSHSAPRIVKQAFSTNLSSIFCCPQMSKRLQFVWRTGRERREGGRPRAYVRLDPGGSGRGPNGDNNGIGRLVFNLALAGGLSYLTVTGKLGWLFDAFISLWLLVILVPIVGFVAFLWYADREIVSGSCPNCGNAFQVLEFTIKDEQQFCPYCSQPFKRTSANHPHCIYEVENKQFVREGPRFSTRQSGGFRSSFGGFGQRTSSTPQSPPDPPGVIVDVEAEVIDRE